MTTGEPLFHGFPRTAAGRAAARSWLESDEPHEDALKRFYDAVGPSGALPRPYRGKPNKHGVRGLSYSEKIDTWTGEFYQRGERLVYRSKDRFEVEMWLMTKQS